MQHKPMQYLLGKDFRHAESVWSFDVVRCASFCASPTYLRMRKKIIIKSSSSIRMGSKKYEQIQLTCCIFRHWPLDCSASNELWSMSPNEVRSDWGISIWIVSSGWAVVSVPCIISPQCVTWAIGCVARTTKDDKRMETKKVHSYN